MDDPTVSVYLDTELVQSYDAPPTFESLISDVATALNKAREEFQVVIVSSGAVVQKSEDLAEAKGSVQLQIVLISGRCLFCSKALVLGTTQCEACRTEDWDGWLAQKHGEEAIEKFAEPQPKLTPAFSFGPNVQVQGQNPKVFEAAKERSEDSKGSGEFDLNDLDRVSQQDSLPDSRRDFPQQEDSTLDRMAAATESTYELKSVLEKQGRESGELREEDLVPKRSESPAQLPGTRKAHDRHHCKICQGQAMSKGRSSGEYYADYFHEAQERRTEAKPLARGNGSERSSLEMRTSAWKENKVRTRRSYGLPETTESMRKCGTCWSEYPWYQDSCQACEVRRSLARHPDSQYKRRVQQWC